jgi:hypothetical protein
VGQKRAGSQSIAKPPPANHQASRRFQLQLCDLPASEQPLLNEGIEPDGIKIRQVPCQLSHGWFAVRPPRTVTQALITKQNGQAIGRKSLSTASQQESPLPRVFLLKTSYDLKVWQKLPNPEREILRQFPRHRYRCFPCRCCRSEF